MSLPRFAVDKPVPVNLLMIAVLIAGATLGLGLRREFFPEVTPDQAIISLPYPGATPEEIEQTLAVKVEDALADLQREVKEIRTTVSEGGGGIIVEFHERINVDRAISEVERKINALQDLPEESKAIQVALLEPRLPVIRVAIFGDADEEVLKRAARDLREELRLLPRMGEIVIDGVRDYEIRIDVRQQALMEQGVSLPQVAQAVRSWMAEVPGGTVQTQAGNVKVRTMGVQERREAIRQIVVRAAADGSSLRVGDIAEVTESFVDEQVINRYSGQSATGLTIYKVGDQDVVAIAEKVRAYVAGRHGQDLHVSLRERLMGSDRLEAWRLGKATARPLPPGIDVQTTSDLARFVEDRLDLLARNAFYGLILVFSTLLLFLNWRVAFWVGVGLLTAVMGTLVLMHFAGITLNLLTMFGLIIVLGLLVDDAIVVSENIQTRHDAGEPALVAAVNGANQVAWPVVATVLTTVVAFLPLTFIKGRIGDLLGALPMVVACALLMSLVEAILLLPSHMGHSLAKRDHSRPTRFVAWIRRGELWRDRIIHERIIPAYTRLLALCLRFRYVSIAVAIATLMVSVGMVHSGRVVFTFLTSSDAETIIVDVRMPIGTPIQRTEDAVNRIDAAARAQPETLSVSSIIGQSADIDTGRPDAAATHIAQMFIELHPVERRDRESSHVIAAIRDELRGRLDDVERVRYSEITGGPGGADISIRVSGADSDRINAAVADIKRQLAMFAGVEDIADDNDLGQLELQVNLLPSAAALGLNVVDVATQVRGFLFGLEAHTFAADQEDIDVRVRVDEATRRSLVELESIWIVTPGGRAVPLSEVATIDEQVSYASIKRVNRRRAVTVTAETRPEVSPETITAALDLDAVRAKYPRLLIEYAGRQEQLADAFGSLPYGFLAATVMIFVILAWLFNSYVQPLVIMLAIPFAIIGVVWGHLLLGYDITFLSVIGFVALSGIVVNDSLILMRFFNDERAAGHSVFIALLHAGRARLRPILLTTITTVLGLLPLILETSFQAKFLIPMAIAIAVGLMSATVLILLVLPCFILAMEDLKAIGRFCWLGQSHPHWPEVHQPAARVMATGELPDKPAGS